MIHAYTYFGVVYMITVCTQLMWVCISLVVPSLVIVCPPALNPDSIRAVIDTVYVCVCVYNCNGNENIIEHTDKIGWKRWQQQRCDRCSATGECERTAIVDRTGDNQGQQHQNKYQQSFSQCFEQSKSHNRTHFDDCDDVAVDIHVDQQR